MARLLADENLPFPVVEELRRLGHDIATLNDLAKANEALPDDAVLALAREQRRAVVTLNRRHFVRLHDEDPRHTGIVVCTVDPNFSALALRIGDEIARLDSLDRQLVRVHRPAR